MKRTESGIPLPHLPMVPLEYLASKERRKDGEQYMGDIEEGMIFAWEPFIPHARRLILITEVFSHSNDETLVRTKSLPLQDGDKGLINDIDHFRYAVYETIFRRWSDRIINSPPLPKNAYNVHIADVPEAGRLLDLYCDMNPCMRLAVLRIVEAVHRTYDAGVKDQMIPPHSPIDDSDFLSLMKGDDDASHEK